MSRGALLLIGLLLGCSDKTVFVETPWPTDALGVIVILDDQARPRFEAPEIVAPGHSVFVELVSSEARQLVAAAYPSDLRAASGRPIGECGVTLEGPGRLLDPPLSEWRSVLSSAEDADDLSFDRLPPGEHIGVELRETLCGDALDPCHSFTFEPMIAGCPTLYRTAVAASESLAYGLSVTSDGMLGTLVRVEPDGCLEISRNHSLAFIYDMVLTSSTTLLATALTATVGVTEILEIRVDRPTIERKQIVASNVPIMDRAPNGRILIGGPGGLYTLSPDGRNATRDPGWVGEAQEIEILRDDRIVVGDYGDALRFFDGEAWSVEWMRPVAGALRLRTVAGSEDHFYAAGVNGLLLERDEISHSWGTLELPVMFTGASEIFNSEMLAGERLLLTGERGMVLAGDRRGWCPLQENGNSNTYHLIARAPSREAAFLFSNDGIRRLVVRDP